MPSGTTPRTRATNTHHPNDEALSARKHHTHTATQSTINVPIYRLPNDQQPPYQSPPPHPCSFIRPKPVRSSIGPPSPSPHPAGGEPALAVPGAGGTHNKGALRRARCHRSPTTSEPPQRRSDTRHAGQLDHAGYVWPTHPGRTPTTRTSNTTPSINRIRVRPASVSANHTRTTIHHNNRNSIGWNETAATRTSDIKSNQ